MTTQQSGALARVLVLDQPRFAAFSTARKAWESVGGPLVAGALCGVAISFSLWLYLLGVVLSVVGGLGTGAQHRTLVAALLRGFVAGAVWALGVVGANQLVGREPAIPFADPAVLFLPWGIVPSMVVVTIVHVVAQRVRASR